MLGDLFSQLCCCCCSKQLSTSLIPREEALAVRTQNGERVPGPPWARPWKFQVPKASLSQHWMGCCRCSKKTRATTETGRNLGFLDIWKRAEAVAEIRGGREAKKSPFCHSAVIRNRSICTPYGGGVCPLDIELHNFPGSSGNISDKWEMAKKKIEKLNWHQWGLYLRQYNEEQTEELWAVFCVDWAWLDSRHLQMKFWSLSL